MVQKVCLDSDILIDFLNKDEEAKNILEKVEGNFCISSVTAFEIWYGRKKSEQVEELLKWIEVLNLDYKSAILAGDILRDLKKKGKPIDFRDLFIGSICIKENIPLVSRNIKDFKRLKRFGLNLI